MEGREQGVKAKGRGQTPEFPPRLRRTADDTHFRFGFSCEFESRSVFTVTRGRAGTRAISKRKGGGGGRLPGSSSLGPLLKGKTPGSQSHWAVLLISFVVWTGHIEQESKEPLRSRELPPTAVYRLGQTR